MRLTNSPAYLPLHRIYSDLHDPKLRSLSVPQNPISSAKSPPDIISLSATLPKNKDLFDAPLKCCTFSLVKLLTLLSHGAFPSEFHCLAREREEDSMRRMRVLEREGVVTEIENEPEVQISRLDLRDIYGTTKASTHAKYKPKRDQQVHHR